MAQKRQRGPNVVELLNALHSFRVNVELRDGRQINAVLDGADAQMNLSLTEATWTSGAPPLGDVETEGAHDAPVWLSSRNLRYVVLPSGIDPVEAIDRHREKVRAARAKYSRGVRPGSKRSAPSSSGTKE